MKMRTFITGLLLHLFAVGSAQTGTSYQGTWMGILQVGQELRLAFHVKDNGSGGLVTTADSPDQSAFGLKCDSTWLSADGITVEMRRLNARFTGKLQSDSVIAGTFHQGMDFPLVLKRSVADAGRPKRPQEPKPPFPYLSEDIVYKDRQGLRDYGATITIPAGGGAFPAAVLITGSGQQNRDEEIMGHKPFAVLADALTRNGFVVLRVDDRGVGKSTGVMKGATTADFAEDVSAGVDYLLSRPEVNKQKIGLIGHSEGGMIAPMVASNRKDINFVVLLAGPGVKISQLMAEQNAAIFKSSGVSEPAINAYITMYTNAYKEILAAPDSATAAIRSGDVVRTWAAETDTAILRQLGLNTVQSQQKIAGAMVEDLQDQWYRYFMQFDPQPYLQALRCKVLALNGSRDVQVIPSSNLAGIDAALKKSKSKLYTVKELAGLNHLFQTCKSCTPAEYGQLEETFAPSALEEINSWLNKNVR